MGRNSIWKRAYENKRNFYWFCFVLLNKRQGEINWNSNTGSKGRVKQWKAWRYKPSARHCGMHFQIKTSTEFSSDHWEYQGAEQTELCQGCTGADGDTAFKLLNVVVSEQDNTTSPPTTYTAAIEQIRPTSSTLFLLLVVTCMMSSVSADSRYWAAAVRQCCAKGVIGIPENRSPDQAEKRQSPVVLRQFLLPTII